MGILRYRINATLCGRLLRSEHKAMVKILGLFSEQELMELLLLVLLLKYYCYCYYITSTNRDFPKILISPINLFSYIHNVYSLILISIKSLLSSKDFRLIVS